MKARHEIGPETRARTGWRAALALTAGSLFAVVALLEIGLRFLPVHDSLAAQPVNARNPVARYQPHREFVFSKGWNLSLVNRGRTNNEGFVHDHDYFPVADPPLLAVIGDSFVEALMVPFEETLQGRLAMGLGSIGRAYSLAMSRSALSQYLVYAEYASRVYAPAAMVFVIVGNDFDEAHESYRSAPWAGRLHYFVGGIDEPWSLVRRDYEPPRWRRWLTRSALARYLYLNLHADETAREAWNRARSLFSARRSEETYVGNTPDRSDDRRMAHSRKAVDTFFERLPRYAGLPAERILFVVDGIRPEVYGEDGLTAGSGSYFARMREYFIRAADSFGYETIDLHPIFYERFRENGKRFEFPNDNHWNGEGHGVAAEMVRASETFRRVYGDRVLAE